MTVVALLGLQGADLVQAGPDCKLRRVPAESALEGKTVAIYFSAHWCPPCRAFTPVLAEVYAAVHKKQDDFEVLFVSCDRDAKQFEEYMSGIPWLAVPWAESEARQRISTQLGVSGIPRLIVVSPQGQVIANDARAAVMADRAGDNFPWAGAAGPSGLVGMLMSPRGLMLLFMAIYYLVQWFTKTQ